MVKGLHGQNLPADVAQVVDQLERYCMAPDGSLISKPLFNDLQPAREEMCRERLRYLEAMAVYSEAVAMVEEYQQAISVSNLGAMRDTGGLYPQLGLRNSPQVYETLEHQMVVAEAAQRLRLPLISKDGEVHTEDIEQLSLGSRSSLESTSTSGLINSSMNSTNYTSPNSSVSGAKSSLASMDPVEPGVGGVPNRFLGITPAYLWQSQHQQTPLSVDMTEYRMSLSRELESRLKVKCDKISDAFIMDDNDSSSGIQSSSSRLPERFELILSDSDSDMDQYKGRDSELKESIRNFGLFKPCARQRWFSALKELYAGGYRGFLSLVKLLIEDIEREETALRDELYSTDRKFAEYYNVLEQILGVLIKLVKDLKLDHQHKYDELQKTWLCKRCETMSAKLRVLEHVLLLETYTKDSIPALHKIRKYLVEATEEASIAYNKAVTRLREYQGVDPHFDNIARQYHDIVKKFENMQWTIHQVEMDLKRLPDNPST